MRDLSHEQNININMLSLCNKQVSQMQAPLVARRKPAGVQNRPQSAICFLT